MILDWLLKLAKLFTTFTIIKRAGITDDLVQRVVPIIADAGARFVDNTERREWAVEQVQKFLPFLSESAARKLVELAVDAWKMSLTK